MLPRATITIILSLGLHSLLVLRIPGKAAKTDNQVVKPLSLKVVDSNHNKNKIMTRQKPDSQPVKDAAESWQDHKAEKQVLPRKISSETSQASSSVTNQERPVDLQSSQKQDVSISQPSSLSDLGKNRLVVKGTTERNLYEKFLSQSANAISKNIENKIENLESGTGDRIDMDTKEYRYMGYFSSLRKAIELVWVYPNDAARRGIEGTVTLEFKIEKTGGTKSIKVIRSSGEPSLDRAIIDAIHLAQPFSPLPDGLGKKQLIVTGNFNYILTGYAISH